MARGWSNDAMPSGRIVEEPSSRQRRMLMAQWKWQWQGFIDHLADGKGRGELFRFAFLAIK
jgi:hypothetical protein